MQDLESLYQWLLRLAWTVPSVRALSNVSLLGQIQEIFDASDQTYCMPRVRAALSNDGVSVSRKRVARLMRQGAMRGVSRRRGYTRTTKSDAAATKAPDWVKRASTATGINQLWVADMTYILTKEGFLYLAIVIDVYSRKVVGWAFDQRMKADLVVSALNMALLTHKPGTTGPGVIHH